MKGKVYGLSIPKAKAPVTGQASRVAPLTNSLMNKKASIFNQSDSDSDNSGKALGTLGTYQGCEYALRQFGSGSVFSLQCGSGSDFLF
jgi:hypothetical protein